MENRVLYNYIGRETTLRDYLRIIFRHKIVFFVFPLTVLIPVYISFEFRTPAHVATVKMYVKAQKEIGVDYYEALPSHTLIEEHAEMVTSNIVLERVVSALKLYQIPIDYEKRFATRLKRTLISRNVEKIKENLLKMTEEQQQKFLFQMAVGRLRGSVSAQPVRDTAFFTITVRDFNPDMAVIIANSIARSYVIFDLEQQIAELQLQYGKMYLGIEKLNNYIEEVKVTLDGRPLSDIEAIGPASVKIVQQAEPGESFMGIAKGPFLVLSFIASIVFSIILVFIIDYLDLRIKSPYEVETFLKTPVLGSIPQRKLRDKLLISDMNPKTTGYSISYQNLSEQLSLLMRDKSLRTLLITDCEGSVETCAISANIGIYLSRKAGYKTLIIDADLRHSSVSKLFNNLDKNGLASILEGKSFFTDTVKNLNDDLYILPSGETALNPITLLNSSSMYNVIVQAKKEYEFIFINCPDLRSYTDAFMLSTITDGTALVINEGKVRRHIVENSINSLRQKNVNIVGAILSNHKYVIPKIVYNLT
ncbi:MAG: polysaccharide biosynthesis tyrosine autokinase [Nitrospirae bacterium]|nr:polysaccharide biosynthesis tyrosine autokinase [Nitrospirota bacterium]